MRLLKCILQKNLCWKKYHAIAFKPKGIVVHSTDKAGKVLKRFVQPFAGQTTGMEIDGKAATAEQMLAVLGENPYANDWNRETIGNQTLEACVHAFLGQVADGSYAACQTLEYTQPCWGAGSGKNGSYNGCLGGVAKEPLYIQFEMIEDSAGDPAHCKKLYELAVEYCAHLMLQYPTIELDNVVSHKEACARGYATNHGDPESYWSRCGMSYTMAKFRKDVAAKVADLKKPAAVQPQTPHHPFEDVPADAWYAPYVQAAWEEGLVNGTDATHFSPEEPLTRAQGATLMVRLLGKILDKLGK